MSETGDEYNSGAEFTGDPQRGGDSALNAQQNYNDLKISVQAAHPELLKGLEAWLQLGLISQAQVKKLARNYLSCALAIPAVIPTTALTSETSSQNNLPQVTSAQPAISLQRIIQSFLDELSIRWLLFLGIFLVLVSSGVLAATQWQNFPDLGQYLVLFVYTLGFWGIGFWTGKQTGLDLTAQTLSAIAILLIPINFWAISHLGLSRTPLELAITIAAVTILSIISYLTFKPRQHLFWLRLLFWLLSCLQLGGHIPQSRFIAIYGGILSLCWIHSQLLASRRKYPVRDLFFVLVAWSLLIGRSITAPDLANYSLAIAIFAWLIGTIYLNQAEKIKVIALKHQSTAMTNAFVAKVGKICGIILFVFTWSISLNAGLVKSSLYFWQTVVISSLAMHLFYQRLRLYRYKRDLTGFFLLGLQTYYLGKELIPPGLRGQAQDFLATVSRTEYFPESVLGVTLFPYLLLYVAIASWLYKRQKTKLALHSEYLTLILGIVLTCLSLTNPTWRSLNLLFSTLTLGYVARIRQPMRNILVYLTHLLGLITIVNAIAVVFPNLSQTSWSIITLALMVFEWGFYLVQLRQRNSTLSIKQSCWYFGLLLATSSYIFLAAVNSPFLGLLWLIAPLMMSLIGKYTPNIYQRRLATVISCVALILAQLLLFSQWETRLLGLTIATGVMFINAFNWRRLFITLIHLGLAIALAGSVTALIFGASLSDYKPWLSIGSLIIILLYQLRQRLLKTSQAPQFGYISQRTAFGILGVGRETQNFKLVNKYLQAANYWAIVLIVSELLVVSAVYFLLPSLKLDQGFGHYLGTTGLLIGALFWRYRSSPSNLVLYTITWLGAIFTGELVRLIVSSSFALATGNIIFGLIAIVVVVLVANANTPWVELNLAYIPLVYAALGIFWRISIFNAYTGLLTLGAAFILLNTQQRNSQINRLTKYLGIAGISGGILELVFYQIQEKEGVSSAQDLTILALVAVAIACGYRLLSWWYRRKEFRTLFTLNLRQIIAIAHIHWVLGSICQFLAVGIILDNPPGSDFLRVVSIATGISLGLYGVFQARLNLESNQRNNYWWVYIGFGEIFATLVYSRLIISWLSIFDPWFAVFTCAVSLLMAQIPWSRFGWCSNPWQRIALILPILVVFIIAQLSNISLNLSLLITALFYLAIAYRHRNIRWSYLSVGLINWYAIRLVGQARFSSILIAGIVSLSILYLAQFEPTLSTKRQPRHYLRIFGSTIFCLMALWELPGIIPGAIAFGFIFVGLGLRIRAFLFTGTITLILTVLHQLVILLFTYSFLKWVVGLLTGISSIAIAAGFENRRVQITRRLKTYRAQLQSWQ